MIRSALPRWLVLFMYWLVLTESARGALPYGVVASSLATWASLSLVPVSDVRIRWGALLRFVPHFVWQSVVAGVDVARRAFDPRMPLRPGFVTYPARFRTRTGCNTFAAITSLLPGTVPCADDDGGIVYHCLDDGQPIVDQLAAEEARLAAIIEEAPDA
jgi:multicomponent Na+:H+ antiporter subunit E